MRLMNFILQNRKLIFQEHNIFHKNVFFRLRAIISNRIPHDTLLNDEDKKLFTSYFQSFSLSFNMDTPSFILNNQDCVKSAIVNNINSINYTDFVNQEITPFIREEALKQGYVLSNRSPLSLKKDYEIALNSIKILPSSANYVDWYSLKYEETNTLINYLIKTQYCLNENSHIYLKNNKEIALSFLSQNIDSISYITPELENDLDIIKMLILAGRYDIYKIKKLPAKVFQDKRIMNYLLKTEITCNISDDDITHLSMIFCDAVNNKPLIKDFDSIFEYIAEKTWLNKKKNSIILYENIFSRILAELKQNDNYNLAVGKMQFISEMKFILEDEYQILNVAMKKYFEIYHSDMENKLTKLEAYKNKISECSSQYISMSKEKVKKDVVNRLQEYLKPYFKVKKNLPLIEKKVLLVHKRIQFKNLYLKKDNDVISFINTLKEKYASFLDNEVLNQLIENYILYNNTDFFPSPEYYNEYEKCLKARKLVNRLNSKYISYNDLELGNYRDVIIFSNSLKKYVYVGRTFTKKEREMYEKWIYQKRIIEKLKKDIYFKINELNIQISNDDFLLKKTIDEIPFKDEFFEFNEVNDPQSENI